MSFRFFSFTKTFVTSFILLYILAIINGEDVCESPSAKTLMKFNLDVNEASRQYIKIDAVPETMTFIENIKTKLSVVAIMGPYRTGKSFLLNQLLPPALQKFVFSVGHSVQPHTEEVTMLLIPPCLLKDTPLQDKDTSLIFLDTPGLFAPNRAAVFDAQLLAILNLLSSVMLYNNFGVVNRGGVEQLNAAIEVAFALSFIENEKALSKDGHSNKTDPNEGASKASKIDRPHLLWIMNNFDLAFTDKNGAATSTKVYIQNVLNQIDSTANGTTGYSERFNKFFSSLDAHGLPFPAEKYLPSKLGEMTEKDFTPEYIEARNLLRNKIFSLLTPKTLGRETIIGRTLSTLVQTWIETVNLPVSSVKDKSSSALLNFIHRKEVDKAVTAYKDIMSKLVFPMPDSELSKKHIEAQDKILEGIREAEMPDFVAAVKRETNALFSTYIAANEGNLKETFGLILSRCREAHSKRLSTLTSSVPLPAGEIEKNEKSTLEEWDLGISPIKVAGASLLSTYKTQLDEFISRERTAVQLANIRAHQNKFIDEAKQSLQSIQLPVDSHVISQKLNHLLSTWSDSIVQVMLVNHPSDAVSSSSKSVKDLLNSEFESINLKNLAESTRVCVAEAGVRAYTLVGSAASNWLHEEKYRSRESFLTLLHAAQFDTPLCVGPAINSTEVALVFARGLKEFDIENERKISPAKIFLILSYLAAVWGFFGIPRYYNAIDWRSVWRGDLCLSLTYPFIALGVLFIARYIPDAVHERAAVFVTVAILFMTSLVAVTTQIRHFKRAKMHRVN